MNRVTTLVELLIIDEAERLKATALELLRDNHDRTHLPMILIGMPGIDQRFRHYPQLYSRLGFSHRYRALGEGAPLRSGPTLETPRPHPRPRRLHRRPGNCRSRTHHPRQLPATRTAIPPDHPHPQNQPTRNHHRRRRRSSSKHPRHRQLATQSENITPPPNEQVHKYGSRRTIPRDLKDT